MRDVSQAVILTKLALKIVNFTKINAKMSECWGLRHSYFQNGPQAHFKVLFTRLVWIRMHFSKGNCDLFIFSIGEKNLCLTAFSKLFYFFFFFVTGTVETAFHQAPVCQLEVSNSLRQIEMHYETSITAVVGTELFFCFVQFLGWVYFLPTVWSILYCTEKCSIEHWNRASERHFLRGYKNWWLRLSEK